jgi:hypothetical protein
MGDSCFTFPELRFMTTVGLRSNEILPVFQLERKLPSLFQALKQNKIEQSFHRRAIMNHRVLLGSCYRCRPHSAMCNFSLFGH